MPRYEKVADGPQLPARREKPKAAAEVTITTDIPVTVRRDLTLACAIHGVKLKAAVTEAIEAWLKEHPPTL